MPTPTLTVDLSALRANYRLLRQRHAGQAVAAVVKANAYGLGVAPVAQALWEEGCREYFVATPAEGAELRRILPEAGIGVFNGLPAGEEKDFAEYRLIPALNDPGQVERFVSQWTVGSGQWQAILHVDTGMTRLGLTQSDLKALLARFQVPGSKFLYLMSHLACAGEPEHPKNAEQLRRFTEALALFPGARASLCNSSGLFLSPGFHFDLGRPGCALYGINPVPGENPMRPVATLCAPLLQIRRLERSESVGYGATCAATAGSRIAIAALGYADGWPRALSNSGFAYVEGCKVPIAGRVSMDMVALDVSAVPEQRLTSASRAEFINAHQTVDDVAAACGTIGYEIFTRIGSRVERRYSQ